jgi:hypothetical protein
MKRLPVLVFFVSVFCFLFISEMNAQLDNPFDLNNKQELQDIKLLKNTNYYIKLYVNCEMKLDIYNSNRTEIKKPKDDNKDRVIDIIYSTKDNRASMYEYGKVDVIVDEKNIVFIYKQASSQFMIAIYKVDDKYYFISFLPGINSQIEYGKATITKVK